MPDPFPSISRKTEQAVVNYLGAITPAIAANIYAGKASADKASPCVVVYAESSKFDDDFSGNAHVTLHVMVKAMMPDVTIADSDQLTSQVFNALSLGGPGDNAALADQLNLQGIADFTCMVSKKMQEEAGSEDSVWVETLTLDLYCAQASGL